MEFFVGFDRSFQMTRALIEKFNKFIHALQCLNLNIFKEKNMFIMFNENLFNKPCFMHEKDVRKEIRPFKTHSKTWTFTKCRSE